MTVLAVCLLLALVLVSTRLRPATSDVWLAPDNPSPDGTMALAGLLRAQGIDVIRTPTVAEALRHAQEGATVAVVLPEFLTDDQREALARAGADVVLVGPTSGDQGMRGLSRIRSGRDSTGTDVPAALEPRCPDEDALAAQSLTGVRRGADLSEAPDAVGCFPLAPDGSGDVYAYATEPLPGGGTLRVLADPSVVVNNSLAEAGHAALAVRALGHAERLVWLEADATTPATLWDSPAVPRWLPVLGLELVLVVVVLAVVQGRRFGPVVTERLPVVVRSTETTIARGRLYRRSADRGRAAAALRAGTAVRLGRALGLPAGATRQNLLDALGRSTSVDRSQAELLLYGPAPPDDRALATLAVRLDYLESEVRSR